YRIRNKGQNKDKTRQNQARDRKERENTSPAVPSDINGPARTWKLSQLKKLKFEEIKEEFDKLVKQVDTFVPMTLKATKAELKRLGEELQTKTTKRQKIDDKDAQSTKEKEKESVKKMGKRRKRIARKGLHTAKDEASEEDDSSSGTNVPINPVPVAV
ncbi:hypothetical protein Tco_1189771, partial [Tanacetum coccineum]